MNAAELGLAIALIGAVTIACILALSLHSERQERRRLEANDAGLRKTIARLENRALEIVKIESDKTVQRLPGENLGAFARRADLEAIKGRDGILSAVLASGHINEHIDIHDGANTARILHTLKVTK